MSSSNSESSQRIGDGISEDEEAKEAGNNFMALLVSKNNNSIGSTSPVVPQTSTSNVAPMTSRGTIKEAHNEDEYDDEDSSKDDSSDSSN